MAKTNFIDANPSQGVLGTLVTASFLNKLGLHRHDGLDEDGHCPLDYYTAGGTANALTVTCNPALTQHVPGLPIYIKTTSANTGACTLNVDGLGAKTIKKTGGLDLAAGDIQAGDIIVVAYESVAGVFMLLCSRSLAVASTTLAGILKLATTSQAQGLTDDTAALTALKLAQAFGGSNQSPDTNGYQKLPGGLILQWGICLIETSITPITYPIAFTRTTLGVFLQNLSGIAALTIGAATLSRTGFVAVASVGGNSHCWMAIGQ